MDQMNVSSSDPSGVAVLSESDAYGRAAMLLVESLMHGLIAKNTLSVAEAIEIVDTAINVEDEVAFETGSPPHSRPALRLLNAVAASLSLDLQD